MVSIDLLYKKIISMTAYIAAIIIATCDLVHKKSSAVGKVYIEM